MPAIGVTEKNEERQVQRRKRHGRRGVEWQKKVQAQRKRQKIGESMNTWRRQRQDEPLSPASNQNTTPTWEMQKVKAK